MHIELKKEMGNHAGSSTDTPESIMGVAAMNSFQSGAQVKVDAWKVFYVFAPDRGRPKSTTGTSEIQPTEPQCF